MNVLKSFLTLLWNQPSRYFVVVHSTIFLQKFQRDVFHFDNITINTRVCIKNFVEKDVHMVTFDIHTHPNVSALY